MRHNDERARPVRDKPRAAIPCAVVRLPHDVAKTQERQYAEHDLIAPVDDPIAAARKRETRRAQT